MVRRYLRMLREPAETLDRVARQIVDAAYAVHRELGPGFLESVYEEALCVELSARGISFSRQQALTVSYRGRAVGQARMDLIVDEVVVVELKAIAALAPIHVAQTISYLKASRLQLALLINFNVSTLR